MAVKVGINGFGRIGRLVFRAMMEHEEEFHILGINDLAPADDLAHLLKYDSAHGGYRGTVEAKDNMLKVDNETVRVLSERDPANLPWKELGVDIAIECTGIFRDNKKDGKAGYDSHLDAGARKVVISAPTKGDAALVVFGVNDDILTADHKCVSNASCTTNSLAPVVKVLDEAIGIEKGLMTTVHGYTADQRIVDSVHKDKRRMRAAAVNIIPTTTGAAKAVGKVYPKLDGKLDGYALRVPVPTGSITDLTITVKKNVTIEEINSLVQKAAEGPFKGIIRYTEDPIVSSDVVHDAHSSIFDAGNTKVMDGNMVKITMWYDNEWGYSNRTAELALKLSKL
jgi:glyceraldehyde 3-phosphate dehydrogenase